ATAANHLPSAPRPIPPRLPPPRRLPPPSQAPPRVLASAVAELTRAGPAELPIGSREWGLLRRWGRGRMASTEPRRRWGGGCAPVRGRAAPPRRAPCRPPD